MDFTPEEGQEAARALAAEIFADLSSHERLSELGTATDAPLWKALCASGLPAAVEEIGLLGLALVLEEQGRRTAQVPLAVTCAYGLLPLAAHGSAEQRAELLPALREGTAVATGVLPERPQVRAAGGLLSGTVPVVPWLRDATHVVLPCAEGRLWLLRTAEAGAVTEPVETTAPWSAGRLTLDGARAEPLHAPYAWLRACVRTAFAALQAGVCAGSLERAVAHTVSREQFGRPLSVHQGVQLRAADAYMDTESIRVTTYEAAWRHDRGLPSETHALTAAWWAAEAGRRVVHSGQHLHGGIGADLEHPVHRHFLWGRQLDAALGSPARLLAELGTALATGPEAEAEPEEAGA
ncbi:acyl-CoA dehydrogenase family protein [Streptomyces sp. HNM0574]|uniref:acyl-CoA dehydrogenase family protein n=1 Tax=Streptomyces sp. HNM0574 TaxID=2714954 RepID=UPI00146B7A5D|nr:acyl-CoA dehydrogenase family protein [Streptomyces sp. HNM0574]NLU69658.1 acyl-CoA/acyl-ACP dehydrogenase [Streptomyces sp. HNM0574]